MATTDFIGKTTLGADIWELVYLSHQANSLLTGAKELITEASDDEIQCRAFDCLQIIEVAMEKLSLITTAYGEKQIAERAKQLEGVSHD